MPSPTAAEPAFPVHLFLPLASSLLYVVAALSLKRASQEGAGIWRTTFVSNVLAGLMFAVMLVYPAKGTGEGLALWQPAAIAALFVAGQALTMYSLNRGDVSVATPVIGTKVIFVAFFVTLLGLDRLYVDYWVSAGMSTAGIALLNMGRGGKHSHVMRTVASALSAAACYAMYDALVRKYSPTWGVSRLLPAAMGMGALFSLAFLPLIEGKLLAISKPARRPMWTGAFFLSLQSVVLVTALGLFPDTTRINVIYNSRGLWSVLAVWLVGHWWANTERHAGGSVFAFRLAGAAMLLGAIVLAVVHPIHSYW